MYGPETHMTSIVAAALKLRPLPESPAAPQTTGQFLLQPERFVCIHLDFLFLNRMIFYTAVLLYFFIFYVTDIIGSWNHTIGTIT